MDRDQSNGGAGPTVLIAELVRKARFGSPAGAMAAIAYGKPGLAIAIGLPTYVPFVLREIRRSVVELKKLARECQR